MAQAKAWLAPIRPRPRSWRPAWLPGGEAAHREESGSVWLILISTRDRPGDANQPLSFPSAPGFRSPPHLTGFLDRLPLWSLPAPSLPQAAPPGPTAQLYFCACAYPLSPHARSPHQQRAGCSVHEVGSWGALVPWAGQCGEPLERGAAVASWLSRFLPPRYWADNVLSSLPLLTSSHLGTPFPPEDRGPVILDGKG